MASSAQMLLAGIAFMMDTVVLIVSAIFGDAVFKPLLAWYYSFQYASPPVIDPGIITWIFPVYFLMLLLMWFSLLLSLYLMSIRDVTSAGGA
jgi:hypothetical protein